MRLHRAEDYDLAGATTRQGIPVTGVARTLLDLCAGEPNPAVARRALHSARKQNLVTWSGLRACLDAHARPGRRGVRTFRDFLDRHAGAGSPESPLEDLILELILDAGLPRPELQYEVAAGGRRYRFDCAYPEFRLGIECKGKGHHSRKRPSRPIRYGRMHSRSPAGTSWSSPGTAIATTPPAS